MPDDPDPRPSTADPAGDGGAERSGIILQAAMDGFWRVDLSGRLLEVNPAYCRMSGYREEELLSSTIDKMVVKPLDQVLASFAKLRTVGAMRFESRHRRKDGSLFDTEVSAKYMTLRGEDQIVAFVRDITEQKRVTTALRDSEERLRRAVAAGNIGLWEWDLASNQVFYSSEWKRQLGYRDDEIADAFTEWQERVHPDDIAGALARVRGYLADPVGLHESEFRLRHRDGTYRWILSQASLERGADGAPSRMLGSHIDISEHRQLEEHRRRSETMTAIGQLAGGIAHDFNNQLAIIAGHAGLLQHQLAEPELGRKAGIILAAAQRSARLTQQLLAYACRAAHRDERIALPAMVAELAEMLQRSVDLRIAVVQRFAASRDIDGDPALFQNALLNLALNACDAMADGGTLTLATADCELAAAQRLRLGLGAGDSAWVEITVADTGCGMAPEVQARLFEPFFTTKLGNKGTGLGLAAVQGTIQHMGGRIAVESRPGQGSTFRLLLPAGRLPPPAAQPTALPSRRLRILVVDDVDDVRDVLCMQLEARGHQATAMADGRQAIAWFAAHAERTDLVLLDHNMPQLSGLDVLAAMRALDPGARIAVITGNAALAMDQGALGMGACAILQKPMPAGVLERLQDHARPLRGAILMIDDDAEYRELAQLFCRKGGYVFAGCASAAEALRILAVQPVVLLLVDLRIPGSDAGRMLAAIRAAGHAMPALILSGDLSSCDLEQLRPLGVVGALVKPSEAAPLLAMIARALDGAA